MSAKIGRQVGFFGVSAHSEGYDASNSGSRKPVRVTKRKQTIKVVKSSDYEDRNKELFRKRDEVNERITAALASETLSNVQRRRLDRSLREVDDLTTDIYELNLGLVRAVVKKFTAHSSVDDALDYESAGVVGLMRAIDSYDPELGSFSSWAYKPIQREVLRAVRANEHRSLNGGDFERRPRILAAEKSLAEELGRPATLDEIAAEAEVTREQVRRVVFAPHTGSLNTVVSSDGAATEVGDLVANNESDISDVLSAAALVSSLSSNGIPLLGERELFVLVRRFGLDDEPTQNLSAIGATMGLSREAVRQIECKALARLQHPTILRRVLMMNEES
jgi:DNA-directed RNA polymerase sigma subunit (sigma70/sigma32)